MKRRRARHRLTYQQRLRLRDSQLALPSHRERGHGGLPINDAAHVRAAAARLSMMKHEGHVTASEYRGAMRKVRAAARRFGVELSE